MAFFPLPDNSGPAVMPFGNSRVVSPTTAPEGQRESSPAFQSATVQLLLSGPAYPLAAGTYSFDFQAKFTTLAALNTAAPSGSYQMVIRAVHDGTRTITLPLNGDVYPGTDPHVSNFTAAQTINPAGAFTLMWDAFNGGTTNDFVQVMIVDASGVTVVQ